MAKAENKAKSRYEGFHRFWTGVTVMAFVVCVAASVVAGAQTITITYRATVVILILSFIGRIIIRTWASWEEMKRGEAETGRR